VPESQQHQVAGEPLRAQQHRPVRAPTLATGRC
jgi:hypothetical protein